MTRNNRLGIRIEREFQPGLEAVLKEQNLSSFADLLRRVATKDVSVVPPLKDAVQQELVITVISKFAHGDYYGGVQLAKAIAPFLTLSQSKLIQSYISPAIEEVIRCVNNQQPFKLWYADSAKDPHTFTCFGGRFNYYERRYYLEVYTKEDNNPKEDLGELQHNRCLRLDRMQQIQAIEGDWHELAEVTAEVRMTGNLCFAYTQEERDRVEWEGDKTLKLYRPITNSFWFYRHFIQYGASATVLSPRSLRDKFFGEISKLYQNYNENNRKQG